MKWISHLSMKAKSEKNCMRSKRLNSRSRPAFVVALALPLLLAGAGPSPASAGPYVEQAEALIGSGFGNFGESVAISGDGSTVLVGAPSQTGGQGREHKEGVAYVFVRSHGSWVQQGATQGRNGSL